MSQTTLDYQSRIIRPPRFAWGYLPVSFLLALVLLIAAGLKAQAAWSPLHPGGGEYGTWTWPAITVEWLLAAWLLSGLVRLWAHRMALTILCVFVGITAWRWVSGRADCGCFGRITIHPAWTLAVDSTLLLLLCFARPALSTTPRRWWKTALRLASATLLISAIPAAAFAWSAATEPKPPPGTRIITVDGENLVGRPLAILDDITPDRPEFKGNLRQGAWRIFIVNSDCKACRYALEVLEDQAASQPAANPAGPLIVLDLSDSTDLFPELFASVTTFHPGPGVYISIQVPVMLYLRDGTVDDAQWDFE